MSCLHTPQVPDAPVSPHSLWLPPLTAPLEPQGPDTERPAPPPGQSPDDKRGGEGERGGEESGGEKVNEGEEEEEEKREAEGIIVCVA